MCKYYLWRYYFTNLIVNTHNSLQTRYNHVALTESTKSFQPCLDNHWKNQHTINNFKPEITDTRSQSTISNYRIISNMKC